MVACYNCDIKPCVNNGFMHGPQRYKCKECDYIFMRVSFRSQHRVNDKTRPSASWSGIVSGNLFRLWTERRR